MSANSKIEWTDHTFNPWWGCAKVSPGCDRCYAERDARRYQPGVPLWGTEKDGAVRRYFGGKHWADPIKWNSAAAKAGVRARVFCASMADVFDNHAIAAQERPKLWALIEATPWLDWLLLTKRIGNARGMLPIHWVQSGAGIPSNVWLGISVVNREEMLRDAPKLRALMARVSFWSYEPALEPLGDIPLDLFPSWIIVGGESGHGARAFDLDWGRSVVRQCKTAGIACFVKQLGGKPTTDHRTRPAGESAYVVLRHHKGGDPSEWPADLRVREFPR